VFVISALRDPDAEGGPLQRIQIVKGWLGPDGEPQERVWDVGGNANDGAGVDLATCAQRGGDAVSLCAVWRDPEFDASTPAFWYSFHVLARVVRFPRLHSIKVAVSLDFDSRFRRWRRHGGRGRG
jgi:hypothetical protein